MAKTLWGGKHGNKFLEPMSVKKSVCTSSKLSKVNETSTSHNPPHWCERSEELE